MSFCANCGAQRSATMKFCAACGVALDAELSTDPSVAPEPKQPAAPRATNVGTAEVRARPSGEIWLDMLRGNWLGAAIVAVAAALTTGLMGMVLALIAKPDDFGVDNTLTLATLIATGAFGANTEGSVTSTEFLEVSGGGSIGLYPFTVTIAVLVVAVALFRRVTREYTSVWHAVTDAIRAAVIFGVCLWVPALVFTADNENLGRGWGSDVDAESLGLDLKIGADPVGALFLGFLILICVLLASVIVRRDLWNQVDQGTALPSWIQRCREWIAAPFAGLATLVMLLPVAGIIGLFAVLLFGEDNDVNVSGDASRLLISTYIAFLANFGMWTLALGSGSPIGGKSEADGTESEEWTRLWGEITEAEPGLWVAPLVLLVVLAVSALVVVRRSSREGALRSLVIWVGMLLLAVPLLVRLTAVHLSGAVEEAGEEYEGSAYFGPDGLQTTVLIVLIAAVVAALVALATGALTPSTVRDQMGRAARGMQRPQSPSHDTGAQFGRHRSASEPDGSIGAPDAST